MATFNFGKLSVDTADATKVGNYLKATHQQTALALRNELGFGKLQHKLARVQLGVTDPSAYIKALQDELTKLDTELVMEYETQYGELLNLGLPEEKAKRLAMDAVKARGFVEQQKLARNYPLDIINESFGQIAETTGSGKKLNVFKKKKEKKLIE